MKKVIVLILSLYFSMNLSAQNYYQEYPITVGVSSMGALNRLECSTYDSVLQSIVTYNSPWKSELIIISSNAYGKVGFTTMINPFQQSSTVGFIIYDQGFHQFIYQEVLVPLPEPTAISTVLCGINWVEVILHYESDFNEITLYRYNPLKHKWGKLTNYGVWHSDVWTLPPLGNVDWAYDEEGYAYYVFYDPISDSSHYKNIDCAHSMNEFKEDHIATKNNCNYENYETYDPQSHEWAKYPRSNISGFISNGIFWASDIDSSFKNFFFIYDHEIQQWVTDSVYSANISNIKINDRVVAYQDSAQVVYMVYHPIQHAWIKDSSSTNGPISGFQIQNGTVKWTDLNGLNSRGYDNSLGWGNYNTSQFLYFHLTDFTTGGFPMVHVRNYSIGTDSVYFDFGDGIVSLNNRQTMWHSYRDSGSYNICIYDSSGTQSWCQSVLMNLCSPSGFISISNDTICEGDSLILSSVSSGGIIQWQSNNGSGWVNETSPGSNSSTYVVATPQTTTYRSLMTNGSCLPFISNELKVFVYNYFGAHTLSDTLIFKCKNFGVPLKVLGLNNVSYQWQINNGTRLDKCIKWYNIKYYCKYNF